MAGGAQRDIEVQSHLARTPRSENWYRTKWEQSFRANEEYANASVGETATLFIENPADSGASLVVTTATGNPSAKSWVRVYDAFDGDVTGGTAVDTENQLLDSSGEGDFNAGVATVERGVTFTDTNTYYSAIRGGGVGAGSRPGTASADPFILEPGRRIVIEVEKIVSDGDDVVINAEWFRDERVFSELSPPYDTDEVE